MMGLGEGQTLDMSNLGRRPVTWKTGHVVVRASPCDTRQSGQVKRVMAYAAGEARLDFSTIEVGEMRMEDKTQLVALLERMANCFPAGLDSSRQDENSYDARPTSSLSSAPAGPGEKE